MGGGVWAVRGGPGGRGEGRVRGGGAAHRRDVAKPVGLTRVAEVEVLPVRARARARARARVRARLRVRVRG